MNQSKLFIGMDSLWHKPIQTQVLHLLTPVLVLEPNNIYVHLLLEVGLEELFSADPGNLPVLQLQEHGSLVHGEYHWLSEIPLYSSIAPSIPFLKRINPNCSFLKIQFLKRTNPNCSFQKSNF